MQEDAYRAWLEAQPITTKTTANQMSWIHRLEAAFGDLDAAFNADSLETILKALDYSRNDAKAGKPLPLGIVSQGDLYETMATLRHAANKYRMFRLSQAAESTALLAQDFAPQASPKSAPTRLIPPTGYWIFQANPDRWEVDKWAASGERSLLYYVSRDDRDLIQAGDLGVIRRTARGATPAGVLALVEVVEATALRPEPDPKFFVDPVLGAKADYRVRLERLLTFDPSILALQLPDEGPFKLMRRGLQRTTTPLSPAAFAHIAALGEFTPLDLAVLRGVRTPALFTHLQQSASALSPKRRAVISHRIERGPVGDMVKATRHHRCQICEALDLTPVAFIKKDGTPYAEAHHVILVSTMQAGGHCHSKKRPLFQIGSAFAFPSDVPGIRPVCS
jgi:hypothetical protein